MFIPKAYQNVDDSTKCPVRFYYRFKERRPPDMLNDDCPFYLAVNNMVTDLTNLQYGIKAQHSVKNL